MPTPRSDLGLAVNAKGLLFAIGGYNPSGGFLTTVESYNPSTNGWVAATSLPHPVGALKAITGANGRIYTFGGWDGGAPVAQVFALDSLQPQKNPFTS
jgi:hypothetical protein